MLIANFLFYSLRKFSMERSCSCTSAALQSASAWTWVIPCADWKARWKLQDSNLLSLSGLVNDSSYEWFSTCLSKRDEFRLCSIIHWILSAWVSAYTKRNYSPSIVANLSLVIFFLPSVVLCLITSGLGHQELEGSGSKKSRTVFKCMVMLEHVKLTG